MLAYHSTDVFCQRFMAEVCISCNPSISEATELGSLRFGEGAAQEISTLSLSCIYQLVGLMEKLQENPIFHGNIYGLL